MTYHKCLFLLAKIIWGVNPSENFFRTLVVLITGLLAVYINGCGADDDAEEPEDALVNLVSVYPPTGSTIAVDAVITIVFDNVPADVIATSGIATVAGRTLTITGPFIPGTFKLTITWADGTQTLTYTAPIPDTEPPKIIGGTITDKDFVKFDRLVAINHDGKIEVEFNEEITGHIEIKDKSGAKIIWLDKFNGTKGILEVVKGYELLKGRSYVIVGKVVDAAGNSTEFKITFEIECWGCGLIPEDPPEDFP